MHMVSLSLCLLAGLGLCAPASANDRDEDPRARLPDSVQRIERETGGKVLQVRPLQRGDREIYRMKVLTPDGRVKIMQDDPRRSPRERDARSREPRPREPERVPPRSRENDPPANKN